MIPQYTINVPYYTAVMKIRIIVFTTVFTQNLFRLATAQLIDTNFLPGDSVTLPPINYDAGIVKRCLYDKVHMLRATNPILDPTAAATLPFANVIHIDKYIKYKAKIEYNDNNTTYPNSTKEPVYVAVLGEIDEAYTGLTPSGTNIF